jgi:hypothetical protein
MLLMSSFVLPWMYCKTHFKSQDYCSSGIPVCFLVCGDIAKHMLQLVLTFLATQLYYELHFTLKFKRTLWMQTWIHGVSAWQLTNINKNTVSHDSSAYGYLLWFNTALSPLLSL